MDPRKVAPPALTQALVSSVGSLSSGGGSDAAKGAKMASVLTNVGAGLLAGLVPGAKPEVQQLSSTRAAHCKRSQDSMA